MILDVNLFLMRFLPFNFLNNETSSHSERVPQIDDSSKTI